jgi:acetylglutamate kinase
MSQRLLIKLGGRAFEQENGFQELAQAILSLPQSQFSILHGGGAEISQALKDHGRPTRFIDGIRVTPAEDMAIIEKVLSETVNQRIASWLSKHGLTCQRMSGKTDQLFLVEPLASTGHDYGFVGQVKQVNGSGVITAMQSGAVPVISPISGDAYDDSFNVNADSAAAALASAINCTGLIFITDVPGVMDSDGICQTLNHQEAQKLIESDVIQGGMVAKMNAAFEALAKGVSAAYIVKWEGVKTLQDLAAGICRSGTILKK